MGLCLPQSPNSGRGQAHSPSQQALGCSGTAGDSEKGAVSHVQGSLDSREPTGLDSEQQRMRSRRRALPAEGTARTEVMRFKGAGHVRE